jgi:serpin B
MRSKLPAVAIGALIFTVLIAAPVAGIEGANQKIYPGSGSDAYPSSVVDEWKSSLSKQTILASGSKTQAIQSLKNQSFTSADFGLQKPSPTPTPVPGADILSPSKYTGSQSKESLMAAYSSEKAAMMKSIPGQISTKDTTPVSNTSKSVVQANNQFALDLYYRLVGDPYQEGANIFFSPWSISTALAITYEGARGPTAEEIQSVFHFPPDAGSRRTGFYEISSGLNRGGTGYTLRTANALWAEKTYPFLPSYISIARNSYSAYLTNLDFINNPEVSRTTINRWVAEQTADRIQDLLPEGSVHPETRLVITNAIYFKGTWDKQFSEKNTIDEEFRISPSQTVTVPMMRRTDKDAKYGYAETDTLQVLDIPYAHKDGKKLSMLVILPRDGDLGAAEASLTAGKVSELQQALVYKQVKVYLPRFRLETDYRLSDTLKEMGMPTAFTPAADFSGMDGTGGLWIDDVFHKAFVDVNEEGTEAAAATAVSMTMGMEFPIEPIPEFRADHPFIFLIQDDDTGNILFMGRVVNPKG